MKANVTSMKVFFQKNPGNVDSDEKIAIYI